ncbi:Hypothetical protein NTJ_10872 [Nesidiocoris tenuis]|uniref:Reverse transcriptase domain-containing protein n=1 Tax=Nesidiocoris tenuis TaxID=355587 RepID=A0ABN7B353_9HEMI|nr:Hypothetical protein NTJ_10872 [Nesidiocoris tenuis]
MTRRFFQGVSLSCLVEEHRASHEVKEWFHSNGLAVNILKSRNLFLSARDVSSVASEDLATAKFLGVTLDHKLDWTNHCGALSKRCSSLVFLLRMLRDKLSRDSQLRVYYAYFQSVMAYGILCWGHSAGAGVVQHRAIRVIADLGFRDDCWKEFVRLHVLTLPSLFILESACYAHQHLERYEIMVEVHEHDPRHADAITIVRKMMTRCRGFDYWGVKFLNCLPAKCRDKRSSLFRARLKNLLVNKAFYSEEEFLMKQWNI